MSHFTNIKTSFQNLIYLEKTLNRLSLPFQKYQHVRENHQNSSLSFKIFPLSGHHLEFVWNGKEYEIVVDFSLWDQSPSLKILMDKIAQEYASELILGESSKMGFQPVVNFNPDENGLKTIILERWNQSENLISNYK